MTKGFAKVIYDLEYEIGKECHNSSSYNGYTGEYGSDFKYPVNIPDGDGKFIRCSGNANYDGEVKYLELKDFKNGALNMKYKFGANELCIGKSIMNVLHYLENRYDLNFEELEKTRTKK